MTSDRDPVMVSGAAVQRSGTAAQSNHPYLLTCRGAWVPRLRTSGRSKTAL